MQHVELPSCIHELIRRYAQSARDSKLTGRAAGLLGCLLLTQALAAPANAQTTWPPVAQQEQQQPKTNAAKPQATPSVSRKLLDKRPVVGAPGLETQLWLIEYAPGASAPSHHHPVPGIGYVFEGAFDSAFGNEPLVHVTAGQSFTDPAQVEHRVFRNASTTHALRFVVAYTIPSGMPAVEFSPSYSLQLTSNAKPLSIQAPALYPETLEVNPKTKQFLVSSVSEGAVYEVGLDGKTKLLVKDERLTSVLGIAVHAASNRLFVTNSDLGVGVRHSNKGVKKEAGVGIYDLTSGKALRYVDLTALLPEGEHLINGIALDPTGNAYVSDSFSPAIYKVDPQGVASVFLQDPEFKGSGVNLNGLVYHPDGYLLAVKKSSGALYRIPVAAPKKFTQVKLATPLFGGDGLALVGANQLLVIANKTPTHASEAALLLDSKDGWSSAELTQTRKLGAIYPTTSVERDGKVYVLSTHLDEWLAQSEAREALLHRARKAEIQELGSIERRP